MLVVEAVMVRSLVPRCTSTGVSTLRTSTACVYSLTVNTLRDNAVKHVTGVTDGASPRRDDEAPRPKGAVRRDTTRTLADRRPGPAGRAHRRHDPLLPTRGAAAAGRAVGPGEGLRAHAPRTARSHPRAPGATVLARRHTGPTRRRPPGHDRGHLRLRRRRVRPR